MVRANRSAIKFIAELEASMQKLRCPQNHNRKTAVRKSKHPL